MGLFNEKDILLMGLVGPQGESGIPALTIKKIIKTSNPTQTGGYSLHLGNYFSRTPIKGEHCPALVQSDVDGVVYKVLLEIGDTYDSGGELFVDTTTCGVHMRLTGEQGPAGESGLTEEEVAAIADEKKTSAVEEANAYTDEEKASAVEEANAYTDERVEKPALVLSLTVETDSLSVTFRNLTGATRIEWGDGKTDNKLSHTLSHTYAAAGDYTVKIYGCTAIGEHAFERCASLQSVVVGRNVTAIGQYAFNYCESLKSVTFSEKSKVEAIGYRAFANCMTLKSIAFPDSVPSIGASAFEGCYAFDTVVIGSGCTSIGSSAFSTGRPDTFGKIIIKALTPPTLGDAIALQGVDQIVVPRESLDAYRTAWGAYADNINTYEDKITAYAYTSDVEEVREQIGDINAVLTAVLGV